MKKTMGWLAAVLLCGLGSTAFAQFDEPFSLTEAPFASPTMDGDISDWMAMRNDSNVLNFSFAHNGRTGPAVGIPLEVNIQYAWDDSNFYFLVEEIADDDPSSGLTDLDWCQECEGSSPGPAPWSTDSVGFYDQGITWPADGDPSDLGPLSTDIKEKGPFTQFWVGLPTAEDMVIDDEVQNYHLTRVLNPGGGEGGARLVGDRSESNFATMIPDLPELTTVQSAHGIIEDGSNGGRGRRVTEAFMRWDQIRYPDPAKNPDLDETEYGTAIVDRLDALNFPEDTVLEVDQMAGHYVEDIAEGYEFRLDPLLVDGLGEPGEDGAFPFGGQTHPSGKEHPNTGHVMEWSDASVVRLTAAATPVAIPGDCNGDGTLGAEDLSCVTTIEDRDLVLATWNSLPGDLDGNGTVAFPDFLILSNNFGSDKTAYSDGNIDLMDGIAFPDFLIMSANFGSEGAAAQSVPEPNSMVLLGVGSLLLSMVRRKRNFVG